MASEPRQKDSDLLKEPWKCKFCPVTHEDEQLPELAFPLLLVHYLNAHPIQLHLLRHYVPPPLIAPPSPPESPDLALQDFTVQDSWTLNDEQVQSAQSSTSSLRPPNFTKRRDSSDGGGTRGRRGKKRRLAVAELSQPLPLRCYHNKEFCPYFPRCRKGRGCSRRHPPCPEQSDRACLVRNDCPFEHDQYEKSCSSCSGRIRPNQLN